MDTAADATTAELDQQVKDAQANFTACLKLRGDVVHAVQSAWPAATCERTYRDLLNARSLTLVSHLFSGVPQLPRTNGVR